MVSANIDPAELESLANESNMAMERLFNEFTVDDINNYQSNSKELEMLLSTTKELEDQVKHIAKEIESAELDNRVISGLVSFDMTKPVCNFRF